MRMNSALKNEILSLGKQKECAKGEVLFCDGDQPKTLYYLLSGSVITVASDTKAHQLVEPGHFICFNDILSETPHKSKAIVYDDAVIITIALKNFLSFLRKNPQLNFQLMRLFLLGQEVHFE